MPQCLRALGELDQDDANILDHREQHLAQVLGLQVALFLASAVRRGADRAHARRADDHLRDLGAETLGELGGVETGDRWRTEEDRRAHRVRVDLEPRDDRRGTERAIEPGLAVGGGEMAIAQSCRFERLGDRRALVGRVRSADLVEPIGEYLGVRGEQRTGRRRMDDGNHAEDYTGAKTGG